MAWPLEESLTIGEGRRRGAWWRMELGRELLFEPSGLPALKSPVPTPLHVTAP